MKKALNSHARRLLRRAEARRVGLVGQLCGEPGRQYVTLRPPVSPERVRALLAHFNLPAHWEGGVFDLLQAFGEINIGYGYLSSYFHPPKAELRLGAAVWLKNYYVLADPFLAKSMYYNPHHRDGWPMSPILGGDEGESPCIQKSPGLIEMWRAHVAGDLLTIFEALISVHGYNVFEA